METMKFTCARFPTMRVGWHKQNSAVQWIAFHEGTLDLKNRGEALGMTEEQVKTIYDRIHKLSEFMSGTILEVTENAEGEPVKVASPSQIPDANFTTAELRDEGILSKREMKALNAAGVSDMRMILGLVGDAENPLDFEKIELDVQTIQAVIPRTKQFKADKQGAPS